MAVGPYELTASELTAMLGADRAGIPYLLLRDGDGRLSLKALDAGEFAIGRSPEAGLPLGWDAQVSRVHARLERIAGQWMLQDDGLSRNGTFLGGERITGWRALHHGDVIRIGGTAIVYRAPADEMDETAAATDGAGAAKLSTAERRVLVALCAPLLDGPGTGVPAGNNEIADRLSLSVAGVKTQIRALFAKLEVDDLQQNQKRAELARRAIAAGLVSPRDL